MSRTGDVLVPPDAIDPTEDFLDSIPLMDYWVPMVKTVRIPKANVLGVEVDITTTQTVWFPWQTGRALRMLAHFRAMDKEEDDE